MEIQLDVIKSLRDNNIYLLRSLGSKDQLPIGIGRSNIAYAIIIHSVITARAKGESWQMSLDSLSNMFHIEKTTLRKYLNYLVHKGILDAVDSTTFIPKMANNPDLPIFIPVYTHATSLAAEAMWNIRTRMMVSPRDTATPPKLPEDAVGASPDLYNGGYTLISYNYKGMVNPEEPLNIIVAHGATNRFEEPLKAAWFAANGIKQSPNGFNILKSGEKFWEQATPELFKINDYKHPDCAPVPFWFTIDIYKFFGTTASESARMQMYRKLILRTQELVKGQPQLFPWITSVGIGNYDQLVQSSRTLRRQVHEAETIKTMTPPPPAVSQQSQVPAVGEKIIEIPKVVEDRSVPPVSIRSHIGPAPLTSAQLIRKVLGCDLDTFTQDALVEQIIQARMFKYSTRLK